LWKFEGKQKQGHENPTEFEREKRNMDKREKWRGEYDQRTYYAHMEMSQ
jgi:hypothetical protein